MGLLLFDLDGTLYSSREILPAAYRTGIKQFNTDYNESLNVPSDPVIFNQVGKPASEIYENLFPELTSEQVDALQERVFSALLEKIQEGSGRLYSGVKPVLEQLQDRFQLALVTNAQTAYMNAVLETHDLEAIFGRTLCNDDAPNGLKSELVEMMLESFRIEPTASRMIGDRHSDLRAATEHNVPFIHTTYGYGDRENFTDHPQIDSLKELLDGKLLPTSNLTGADRES
ncbi:MAG: HAD family hydrolase [bacterium]